MVDKQDSLFYQADESLRIMAVYRFSLPLVTAVRLRGVELQKRKGLIVEACDSAGHWHYGEASPLPGFSRETLSEVEERLLALLNSEHDNSSLYSLRKTVLENSTLPSLIFALDSVMFNSQSDTHVKLAPLLLESTRTDQMLLQWSQHWPDEVKVKVGGDIDGALQRIVDLLQQMPEQVRIRLDANRRWTLERVVAFVRQLPFYRVSYIEEPCENRADFYHFYQATKVGFAWDETLTEPEFNISWLSSEGQALEGLRAVILKPTLLGSLEHIASVVGEAKRLGVRTVFSSSIESPLGVGMIRRLCGAYAPQESAGLDTLSLFKSNDFALPDSGKRISSRMKKTMEVLWQCSAVH